MTSDATNTNDRNQTTEAPVLFKQDGPVGHILLNRPRALNALDLEMVDLMAAKLKSWESDSSIKVVIVEGAGEKAFCAGGDIRGLYDARAVDDEEMLDAFYRREYQLNHYIAQYPKPYVALMDGITMGGGVGVSIHGRFRVATECTMFAMPETGIGFFPDVGGGYFLPRCPGQIGMYLGLTGARLKAADCMYAGLATHATTSDQVAAIKSALTKADYTNDTFDTVSDILSGFNKDMGEAALASDRDHIDRLFSGGSVAAILEGLGQDDSAFAQNCLKMLGTKSPTALCVSFEQIRLGQDMTLADVLKMEFRLSQRMVCKPDLFEGVRAVIIDKDHAPKWQFGDVGQVDPREVAEYFELLPTERELNL
ncbi:enoyl-CoA hydratase/isomerase family protein [Thalassospira lucentensis]|uniref:enoyl-CoA hydratase/isomerase family protein n=1 Tax=Thalassospira lucentensis TaxID=168935 RepID=UPI00142DDFCF|nr:enoyl-CoA hydratase/isomerase family protein [Thalassospira lucentensis]NIZ02206.1 enoyl-CoA hydratase/isomerase family protein [Thalassospira lucentensis]